MRITVVMATLFLATVAAGQSPESDQDRQALVEELRALRAKVDELEHAAAAQPRTQPSVTDKQTADSVLKDAERHSQLIDAQGFTAGYSNGKFLIQSEDRNFVFNPSIWLQFRYAVNHREENAANKIDGRPDTESGFEVRRLKVGFEGNLFTPQLQYLFRFNTNRSDGSLFLEDGYVTYAFTDMLAIKGGQYKDPTFHEELMSDVRQLACERSLVNFTLGGGQLDREQGVALVIDDGPKGMPWRAEVGYIDGANSKNTNFIDGGGSAFFDDAAPDFGSYARGEYLLFGDWKNYQDFTAMGDKEDLLVVGGGMHYDQAGDSDVLFHTVDAQYEHDRLGVYGAYLGVYSDSSSAGSLYDWGLLAQAAYLLSPKWEVFGRYEYIHLDPGHGLSDDYHVLGAGVNYYIHGHNMKFTADFSYLPNGTPINADGLDILNPDADESQFVVRGQFQLLL